jgi:hypothetical protein
VFAAVAELRRDKPLHPKGVVVDARLRRTGGLSLGVPWLDSAGDDVARVRVSRSVGLPGWLPDVLGLAIRIESSGSAHDVLLASSRRPIGLRHLFVPARNASTAFYSSAFTYRTPSGPIVLGAAAEPGGFALLAAPVSGEWTRFATLTLSEGVPLQDRPISFDPVLNPLPGLSLTPALAALREPSYAAARRHRPGVTIS